MNSPKTSPIKKVRVLLGTKSHNVYVGSGAMSCLDHWLKKQPPQRAFIIADQKVKQARQELVQTLQSYQWEVHEMTVQAGEALKNLSTLGSLYSTLFQKKANRDSVLFALGGGTIGDVTGFIASTYFRGIQWVGLPTTLLAQVDSSIGGKTGLNHAEGKNCIGTIYQPALVICETQFLKTLKLREMISGLGEMIKYGLIFDPKFFYLLQKNWDQILAQEPDCLTHAIQKCLFWKSKVITKDEWDQKGIREVLNFGHTFGHALEVSTHYEMFQHGEAVIWGMRFALALSVVRKKLTLKKQLKLDHFLFQLKVPPLPIDLNLSSLFHIILHDKKVRNGKVRFILLKDIGKPFSDSEVTSDDLHQAFQLLLNPCKVSNQKIQEAME